MNQPMKLYPYQQTALDAIQQHNKGVVVIPTGGGKTIVMMEDVKGKLLASTSPLTVVIVCPRIMLATQLCSEFEEYLKEFSISISHVHSGETHYHSTTSPGNLKAQSAIVKALNHHHFIFTTYNSLKRVNESGITLDVVYFDEAHHCVKQSNFVGVAQTSASSNAAYFFTATPRVNNTPQSMNNTDVYGQKIVSIPAQELIDVGSIIPPQVEVFEHNHTRTKFNAAYVDSENVIDILSSFDETGAHKVLVAAPSTKVIWEMVSQSDALHRLNEMGYEVLHITSKHGAYIGKKKVSREVFFDTLTDYGNDPDKKFVVLHVSILSEGIDCPGLTHCIMLRNLPMIEMCQTIGRTIRLHKEDRKALQEGKIKPGQFAFYHKPCGKIIVPTAEGTSNAIEKRLKIIVDAVFVKGEFIAS
jgi:superfamily II DNA or RNA helicase